MRLRWWFKVDDRVQTRSGMYHGIVTAIGKRPSLGVMDTFVTILFDEKHFLTDRTQTLSKKWVEFETKVKR